MIQSHTIKNTLKQSENQGSAVFAITDWFKRIINLLNYQPLPKIKRKRKTDVIESVRPSAILQQANSFDDVNNIITTNMEDII